MLKLFNVSSTIHFVSRSILIFNPFSQPHYQTSRFKPVPQQHQKPIKNSQHPSARFFCIFQKNDIHPNQFTQFEISRRAVPLDPSPPRRFFSSPSILSRRFSKYREPVTRARVEACYRA